MKKRMYKIMALAMTAAMVVPMAAQTTAFAADDKEITYWNIDGREPGAKILLLQQQTSLTKKQSQAIL